MEQISRRIRIVKSSTSASDTLISPATTSPLSSTRSSTSTKPVERPCPSPSGVGISCVFYGFLVSALRCGCASCYLSNGDATLDRHIWYGTFVELHRRPTSAHIHRIFFLQFQEPTRCIDHEVVGPEMIGRKANRAKTIARQAHERRRGARSSPIDDRVAHEERLTRIDCTQ